MILWFSLAACLLASCFLPILGQKILKRRIIFVDLALAQVAAVGYAIGLAADGNGMLYAALITSLTVVVMAYLPDSTDLPKEAVMGALYALATSVGMMILALMPHAEGQMMELIFGSVLGVNELELFIMAFAGFSALLISRYGDSGTFAGRILFYGSLALAIVPAIYAVGVILVFAMLVVPGLAVWNNADNGASLHAVLIAVSASVLGIISSNQFDLPPSSSVVVIMALFALLWRAIGRKVERG